MSTTKKEVTDRQGVEHARLARSKGIPREVYQGAHDNGTMSRILDAVKVGARIIILPPLVAPAGARIMTVKVKVQLDRPWDEAVNAAGPQTPDSYNVRKVGDLYLPTGAGIVEEEMILLNYPQGGGSFDKALAWAQSMHLHLTDPRQVFVIGEDRPWFYRDIGMSYAYVVATEECAFDGNRQACYVGWGASDRRAGLIPVEDFSNTDDWFAFR